MSNLEEIDDDGKDALLNTECAIKTNKGKLYICGLNNGLIKKINKLHLKQMTDEQAVFNLMEA